MKALTVVCIAFTILTIISQNKASDEFEPLPKYLVKDPRKPLNAKVQILNSRKQELFKKHQLKKLRSKRRDVGEVSLYTTFEAPVTSSGPKFPVGLEKVYGVRPIKKVGDLRLFADPVGLIRKKRAAPQPHGPKNVKVDQKAVTQKSKSGLKVGLTLNTKAKAKANTRRTHHSKQTLRVSSVTMMNRRHGKKGRKRHHSKSKKKGRRQKLHKHKALRRNSANKTVQESRRLIAAKDCKIEDYPYVVSIQKSGEHWCGGALLNPRIVITTANCVWKSEQLSRMKIRAGSRRSDTGGQIARIQEVMKHPDWSIRKTPNADVAIILLDRLIKFSDSVHGADLPNKAMMPPFEDAWITSWGSERRDGIYNDDDHLSLQAIHNYLMPMDQCNNITQRFGVAVNENFICFAQTGRRAPCTRDTGAPAVSDGVVWGLASWGIRKLCGTERFPAMFSYLGSEANQRFIVNATKVLMSDLRDKPFLDRFPYREPVTVQKINLNALLK